MVRHQSPSLSPSWKRGQCHFGHREQQRAGPQYWLRVIHLLSDFTLAHPMLRLLGHWKDLRQVSVPQIPQTWIWKSALTLALLTLASHFLSEPLFFSSGKWETNSNNEPYPSGLCQEFQEEMKVKLTAQGHREKTHPSLSGTILLLKLKVSRFRNPSILGKVDGWSPYQAGTHIWQQGVKDILRRPQRSGSSKPDGPEQWRSLAQGDAGKHPGLCISEPLAQ